MQATNPTSRIIAVADAPRSDLPRLIQRLEGDLLELVVHSIEGVRDWLIRTAR